MNVIGGFFFGMTITFALAVLLWPSIERCSMDRYSVAIYEANGKKCYFTLDNSDGQLQVAQGPTGEHCVGITPVGFLWEQN